MNSITQSLTSIVTLDRFGGHPILPQHHGVTALHAEVSLDREPDRSVTPQNFGLG